MNIQLPPVSLESSHSLALRQGAAPSTAANKELRVVALLAGLSSIPTAPIAVEVASAVCLLCDQAIGANLDGLCVLASVAAALCQGEPRHGRIVTLTAQVGIERIQICVIVAVVVHVAHPALSHP